MQQDEVKAKLLRLRDLCEEFTVVFSGKKSARLNGLYKYSRKEILIHNLNFIDGDNKLNENRLMYTAIHEFAHHVLATEFGQRGSRSHTQLFWSCFHDLLARAEREGIYRLDLDPETQALAEQARRISAQIAALQRELGEILNRTMELCLKQGIRAEDVFQRKMQLTISTCRKARATAELGKTEAEGIGVDQQAAVLGARGPEAQAAILQGSREGKTVEQLKRPAVPPSIRPGDRLEELIRERQRLEKTIHSLENRLAQVKILLEDHGQGPPGAEGREAS
jgi:hypothetical protein